MSAAKKKAAKRWSKKDLEEILRAIRSGAVSKVKGFIEKGWSPKGSLQSFNPLEYTRNLRMVELLIGAGALVDEAFQGLPPIIFHGSRGHLEMVKCLLANGADVDVQVSKNARRWQVPIGYTALMTSIRCNRSEVFDLLLKAGANIDLEDSRGWTALNYALRGERMTSQKHCSGEVRG